MPMGRAKRVADLAAALPDSAADTLGKYSGVARSPTHSESSAPRLGLRCSPRSAR